MRLPARLFNRSVDSHKGDFGHVFILAGSRCYMGAACLCAQSAMRSGAGLVTLGIPESLHAIAASHVTEVMTLPLPETIDKSLSVKALPQIKNFLKKATCLLLGPGLSCNTETQRLVKNIIVEADVPMVIDADALNAIVGELDILKGAKKQVVLTPHPGEMARLCDVSVASIQQDRIRVAKNFVIRYNNTLVLKGCGTVVAAPRKNIYVNKSGNPGMATAGCGDVLSGILAAFLAQGMDAYTAACCAVYIHGLAGDIAARDKTQISLIASDIIEYLPKAFKKAGK